MRETLLPQLVGARVSTSSPRGVPINSVSLSGVRKYPGAIALTQSPCRAHSIANDFVKEATPALHAQYAATS